MPWCQRSSRSRWREAVYLVGGGNAILVFGVRMAPTRVGLPLFLVSGAVVEVIFWGGLALRTNPGCPTRQSKKIVRELSGP